ncbi:mitogen-activated protein kinase kinase kinase 14 [Neoarius graeffei]|uniref:mitogen-activated protein kinase kinase kinase 14 n=1 Tax=Neoarius graeffei TaxID=443677 RepID=UPI00298C83EA|nr:mitogen-activated protein kinase kinase kinase 14 [Neoarius graeffei]XP_060758047.1 mitogen-activated protein kinase kinase kinase 14 [Neoarius graeffei]XP_060758048.1 mitogen-activated protein kinase kinase kinase 14 [Neoarius graeffei]
MARVQRIFNSTQPFSMSTTQPKLKVHGCLASIPEPQSPVTSGKDDKQHGLTDYSNFLLKVISHGTAKHVGTGPLGTEKPSIIAQAECESQDSQEFCPNSRHKNAYSNFRAALSSPHGTVSHRQSRRKRRKRQRRREGQQRDGGSERVRERRLTRVPQQDSGEPGECSYISSNSSSAISTESLSVQETAAPSFSSHPSHISVQLSSKSWEGLYTTPHGLASYSQESERSLNPDSPLVSEAECSLALAGLRNNVSQAECSFASAFAKQMVRDVKDREDEKDGEDEMEESNTNEGILFKEELQPQDYEYREGRDYECCDLLKQGSFGVVYSIRDKSSGFVCAAKKVPIERFRSDEVGSWSALQSPHVVEFFGFVREGRSVILFMDLKPGSLRQLLAERGLLPEDLSLHYMHQVLGALEHLHKRRILHLDVKVDNVLLSEDGKNTFLCDFGESERLDPYGFSPSQALKGTETHMAPEVARGEKRCAKVDVWSSCCMLLHMLNGCQPWTRYYSRPLYLKIAKEPPPLREIPPNCSPHTADVIKRGLQREPSRRASAKDLRVQTAKALKQLGGLRSPARGGAYQKPIGKPERCVPSHFSDSSVQQWMGPGQEWRERAGLRAEPKCRKQRVEKVDDVKVENDREEEIVLRKESYVSPPSPLYLHSPPHESHKPTEQELRKLEREFFLSSLSQPHSAELQEQLLSCLGSDCLSSREPGDKKDSGRWSVGPGDDLSSGVFSYNSQSDGQSFSMDWLGPAHQPPPRCFEGVDVCIRDFNGRCLRIRETPRVKVGHIAIGISDQISESVFSLQSEDGSLVPHDKPVQDAGLFLRCVPAPDSVHVPQHRRGSSCNMPWSWRIRDGRLEIRD